MILRTYRRFEHYTQNPYVVICLGNSLLIDIHYKEMGIEDIWGTRRVKRLCSLMKVTEGELASMMLVRHKDMEAYIKFDEFPGPVCLLLTIIENYAVSPVLPDPIQGNIIFYKNGLQENT